MSAVTTEFDRAATTPRPALARDTWNVFIRELRPVIRDPFQQVFSLGQPVVFLALFGPLLIGGSGQPAGVVLQWFVPGILVMIALFATSFTGAGLLLEMQTGSHERTLVAPLSRSSLIIGRAFKEMVPLVVQVAIIAIVTVPFGFRPSPMGMLFGLVMIALFGIGFGSLSYALALASRTKEWLFWTVQQSVLFPLMILSGMLLPLEDGPSWMQTLAKLNPLTYVVTGERALFAGDFANPDILAGFVAAGSLCLVGLAIAVRMMRRSTG